MARLIRPEHLSAIEDTQLVDLLSEGDLEEMGFSQKPDPQGKIITLVTELLNQRHGYTFKPGNLNGKKIWTRSLGNGCIDVYITFEQNRQNKGFSFVDDKEVLELLYIEA